MVLNCALLSLLFFTSAAAQAFVLLSGSTEARLEASIEQPQVAFILSPNAPPISDKASFADGAYQDLGDQDFWLVLVQRAMQQWNEIHGTYIEMTVSISDAAVLDSQDGVHSIVVGATNVSSSAYAKPTIEGQTIRDCDIAVSSRGAKAESLAFTLMHELGHCLGLGHNHHDYKAAMGYSRENRNLELGLDDEAGVIFLYPDASVGPPEEMIRCGTISGATQHAAPLVPWLLAMLPLAVAALHRWRSPAQSRGRVENS